MNFNTLSVIGGLLIGMSVSMMLLFNGRVTGISGIVNGMLAKNFTENLWRWFFVGGLISGGFFLKVFYPDSLVNSFEQSPWLVVLAGLLVGYGTVLGSGCTSGHGVCGISRLSPRSLVATITFITFGILSATVFRIVVGGI